MSRKKWTAQTEVNDSLLQFREKRKWQIALRRYVLEKNKSSYYAPYFGVDIDKFRQWIEIKFDKDLNWENFSEAWQFDHVVPIAYFDFTNEEDLRLCWNFINIQIEKLEQSKDRKIGIDVLAAKSYFENLFQKTNYSLCRKMVQKINRIEQSEVAENNKIENFILENKSYLDAVAGFSFYEFDKLNSGTKLKEILFEKEFLKKYGA